MLEEIILPQIKKEKETDFQGKFVIEPLYPGYGTTLGNSLRRVLLSSLPGAAIVSVKIEGVQHEFSTIPGVKEDVVEIILNLKQLRLKLFKDEPVKLTLEAKGKGVVKAKDIKEHPDVEIVTPELVIATLESPNAKLSMELKAEKGRGYVPVEQIEKGRPEINEIFLDAIYSPIKKVAYFVENTRVGKMTNFDKLTIELETDGTIKPSEALVEASKILVDHFMLISGEKKVEIQEPKEKEKEVKEELLEAPIEELDFSTRTLNALLKNGIKVTKQLLELTEEDFKKLKGFGAKAKEEVLEKLKELGLKEEK